MKAKPKAKKADKQILVDSLKTTLSGAQALYYTDFTGLNVKRMTELRRRLRKAGVEFTEFSAPATPQMSQLGCSTADAIVS